MDPSLSYSDNQFQRMYTEGHFYDDFSKEDSKLLISVLNSTPALQEQELSYLPPEYYMRYDNYYPMISQQNEMMRMNKKNYQDSNNYNVNVHLNYYPEEELLYYQKAQTMNYGENHSMHAPQNSYFNIDSKQDSFQNMSSNFDFKPHSLKFKGDSQSDIKSDDSGDLSNDNQKVKRRESQNRASRNYRQRKKAYIKEIEEKLDRLRLENENLRNENQKNRRVINQFRTIVEKPPLLRSFSSEINLEDQEIDRIVNKLSNVASESSEDEEKLKALLKSFHEHVSKRQKILQKDALQYINPKMQEKLVRLEGIPPSQVEMKLNEWLQEASQFVSHDQIQKLNELKQRHYESRAKIWEERNQINKDIKEFYQKKLALESNDWPPQKPDSEAIQILTNKLEDLKKNLTKESELNIKSVSEFSTILTPHQEAFITVKHYNLYKEKVTAFQMLNNVWTFLSKDSENAKNHPN